MDIYILREGSQTGPFSEEMTQNLIKQGGALPTDLAWRPGMSQWIPLQNVLNSAPAAKAPAAPAASPTPEATPVAAASPVAAPASAAASSETSAALKESTAPAAAPAPQSTAPAPSPVSNPLAKPDSLSPEKRATEPASARQKAFLSYMGIPFAPDIAKAEAALLANEVLEHSKDASKLARWNEDRLRLHPELFAAEIQAKKDNRASRFFELAETEGVECFDGLSKAHCQVLVGYLDVKFPNWDAKEIEGAWNYFFPAVAEKFPDVVNKEWRSKFKYPTGPKVAAELAGRSPSSRLTSRQRPSPVLAVLKGLAIGTVVICVFAGGLYVATHSSTFGAHPSQQPGATTAKTETLASAPVMPDASPAPIHVRQKPQPKVAPDASADGLKRIATADMTAPAQNPARRAATGNAEGAPASIPAAPAPVAAAPADPVAGAPGAPTDSTVPAAPVASGDMKPSGGGLPENVSLFGSPTPAAPAASGTPAPADAVPGDPTAAKGANPSSLDPIFGSAAGTPAAPGAAAPATPHRAEVILTKAVEVPVAFGKAKLPIGTHLHLVGQEGTVVKVNYLNQVVAIPASSTDVNGGDGQ